MRNSVFAVKVAATFWLLGVMTGVTTAAQAASVTPQTAARFQDSVGVNAPVEYVNDSQFNTMVTRLNSAGIRHVRIGATKPRFPADTVPLSVYNPRVWTLSQNGITSSIIFDPRDGWKPSDLVNFIVNNVGWQNVMIEGPNEPAYGPTSNMVNGRYVFDWIFRYPYSYVYNSGDGTPYQSGQSNDAALAQYTRDVWNALKSNTQTQNVPVVFPSPYYDNYPNYYTNGLGNLSTYVNYGNIHPYCQDQPGARLKVNMDGVAQNVPGKPVLATEFGWHTAMNRAGDDGHWMKGRPEDIQAKYLLRALFYHFTRGVYRSYIYNFAEAGDSATAQYAENHFGLLRPDYSAKPAYTAISNLINRIKDGGSVSPAPLDFNLTGDTSNIEWALLQHSNGKYILAIYNNSSSYNLDTKTYTTLANRFLTLTVNRAISGVAVYSPLNNTTSYPALQNGNSISLSVPDHPVLVELMPGATTTNYGIANGTYKLINKYSGKALTVSGGSTAENANVNQYTYNGWTNQQWGVVSLGNNFYKLVAKNSRKALNVDGWNMNNGANVSQYTFGWGGNQQWLLQSLGSGYYKLFAQHSGRALQVDGWSTAENGNVGLWEYGSSDPQLWRFDWLSSDTSFAN